MIFLYAYLERTPTEGEMCISESRKDKPWLYLSIANTIIFSICVMPLHFTAFQLKCTLGASLVVPAHTG